MEEPDDDFDVPPSTGPLPLRSMLRRERQRLKERRQQSSPASPLSRIMHVALYLYMARLAFTCFALFPGGLGMLVQSIYERYYTTLTRPDYLPVQLQELDWATMCSQRGGIDAAIKALHVRALPAVIRGAPSMPAGDVAAALLSLYARSNYSYNANDADGCDDANTLRAQRDGNNVFYSAQCGGAWDSGPHPYAFSTSARPRRLTKKEGDDLFTPRALLRRGGLGSGCDRRGRGARGYWQWRLSMPDMASAPLAAQELSAPLQELLAAAMPSSRASRSLAAPAELLLTSGYNVSEHTRFDASERFVFQAAGSRMYTVAPPLVIDLHNPPPSPHRMRHHGAYASAKAPAVVVSGVPLWEVLLLPGDVLFVPAYYLYSSDHGASTPCHSLTLSAAPPGAAAAETQHALRKAQLPFAAADSRGVQLAALGLMARELLRLWGQSVEDFAVTRTLPYPRLDSQSALPFSPPAIGRSRAAGGRVSARRRAASGRQCLLRRRAALLAAAPAHGHAQQQPPRRRRAAAGECAHGQGAVHAASAAEAAAFRGILRIYALPALLLAPISCISYMLHMLHTCTLISTRY